MWTLHMVGSTWWATHGGQSERRTRVSRIAVAQPIATVRASFLLEGVDPKAKGQNAGVCGFPSRRLDRTANVGFIQWQEIAARVWRGYEGFRLGQRGFVRVDQIRVWHN